MWPKLLKILGENYSKKFSSGTQTGISKAKCRWYQQHRTQETHKEASENIASFDGHSGAPASYRLPSLPQVFDTARLLVASSPNHKLENIHAVFEKLDSRDQIKLSDYIRSIRYKTEIWSGILSQIEKLGILKWRGTPSNIPHDFYTERWFLRLPHQYSTSDIFSMNF